MKLIIATDKQETNVLKIYENVKDILEDHEDEGYINTSLSACINSGASYKGYKYTSVNTNKPIKAYKLIYHPIYKQMKDMLAQLKVHKYK